MIPKQTFVPVGCSFCCVCVSNVKYFRSEVKALSLHLARPSQAVVTHTKPLLTGIGAQTSGQAQLDAWSQRMFPALYFSMFANIVITFPLCVSFTGEEVYQCSSHLGNLSVDLCVAALELLLPCTCSPGAPGETRNSHPGLGTRVHTTKPLPPSCYRAGKQKTGFIYNLPRVETKRSDPLLLEISQATQEEK